jgi:uncharacterized protein YecE (DUF72 family)
VTAADARARRRRNPGLVVCVPQGQSAPVRDALRGRRTDSSFYALPSPRVVARWIEVTSRHFTFDVKLHRLLSRHAAPLSSLPSDLRARADVAESGRVILDERQRALCSRTVEVVEPLRTAGKLSSFLLQLTPAFKPPTTSSASSSALLECFAPIPAAIELRHRDWLREPETTLDWFRAADAAFVCVDAPEVNAAHARAPQLVTTSLRSSSGRRRGASSVLAHDRMSAHGSRRRRCDAARFSASSGPGRSCGLRAPPSAGCGDRCHGAAGTEYGATAVWA